MKKSKPVKTKVAGKPFVYGMEAEVVRRKWHGRDVVERRGFENESVSGEGTHFYYRGLERFYAHKIANLLFPDHFFNPIYQKGNENRFNPRAVLRSLPKFGDEVFEHFLDHFYNRKRLKGVYFNCDTCKEHISRSKSFQVMHLRTKFEEAGIHVNGHEANVGFKDGKPIFYELAAPGIEPTVTRKFLEKMKDEKLKKKVLKYLDRFDFHEKTS